MKLIIAGGRDFDDFEYLCETLNLWKSFNDVSHVVCGMAKGADLLGHTWAMANGIEIIEMPAQWRINGMFDRSAGYRRNVEMANVADSLIAFWDGKSRGTKHMIDTMKKMKKPHSIAAYGIHFRPYTGNVSVDTA